MQKVIEVDGRKLIIVVKLNAEAERRMNGNKWHHIECYQEVPTGEPLRKAKINVENNLEDAVVAFEVECQDLFKPEEQSKEQGILDSLGYE